MEPLTVSQIMGLANRVLGTGKNELLCANLSGRIRYANDSACSTLGYTFADMLEKRIADYTPTYSDDTWSQHCQRTIDNGGDRIYTYHENCSGSRYPVSLYSIPHLIEEAQEQLICTLVQNARESQRYQRMLENVEHSKRVGSFDLDLRDQSIVVSSNLLAIMGTKDPEDLQLSAIVDRLTKEQVPAWNAEMIELSSDYHRLERDFVMQIAGGRQALVRVIMWSTKQQGEVTGITGHYEVIDDYAKERLISLDECQRQHIIRALRYTKGRVTGPNGAGRLLDINGKTLFARMKKLRINRDDYTSR